MLEKQLTTDESAQHAPRVWVLLGEGAGGNAQMCALAAALGWPYETRQLRWNLLNHLPNPLIGARAFTLDSAADPLVPPWPDLVIGASRRSAPVARWIKQQSGGHTRLVHLLHTQMPLHHFDLVVTLAQFRVPDAPNVLRNTLPLNVVADSDRAEAAQRWAPRLAHLPRPWTAVLVGGDSSSYELDAQIASALAARANDMALESGGSLLVTTSKRTSGPATQALAAGLSAPHYLHCWQAGDNDNPYPAYLALADDFLVTGDSASLPAEAVATGRPVALFEWARKPSWHRLSGTAGPFIDGFASRVHDRLVYAGWRKPSRDFGAFHRVLREAQLVDTDAPAAAPDDMATTVARIRSLMSGAGRHPNT